jgi:hypothetical protein
MFDINAEVRKFANPESTVIKMMMEQMDSFIDNVTSGIADPIANIQRHVDLLQQKFGAAVPLLFATLDQQILLKKDLEEMGENVREVMDLEDEDDMHEFQMAFVKALKNEKTDLGYLELKKVVREPLQKFQDELVCILQKHVNPGLEGLVKEMVETSIAMLKYYGEQQILAVVKGQWEEAATAVAHTALSLATILDRVPGIAQATNVPMN